MKEIKHKALLTIHGADKMNNRDIKAIQKWLLQVSATLTVTAYAKVTKFRLMK